ncbi:hypothetical protein BGZ99_000158 [Dissophora globulifera]|uniref:Uncharacterized protein n=1 Tax=Dissophora globulifera TaxID=979702 RepID=A0A9P6RQS4_9FUNG|nr:hypothetical protein BGZ99_000158 [Dissophora globulifera]
MLSTKVLSSGFLRPAVGSAIRQQQQTCAFSISTRHQEQEQEQPRKSEHSVDRTPYRSPRYLLELAERQKRGGAGAGAGGAEASGRRSGGYPRSGDLDSPRRPSNTRRPRFSDRQSSSDSGNVTSPSRFKAQPSIPYNTSKELQFEEEIDWEVSSVLKSRPLYANIAAGRGTIPELGTAAVSGSQYNTALPGTAISAHITGVRTHGVFDPEVEQSLIQDLATVTLQADKDHRKKADLTSVENQPVLFNLTHNVQEVMNPRNKINRFNNGNIKHVANISYDSSASDEVSSSGTSSTDLQQERSWKRLERLGGDYTRASSPSSLLASKAVASENGKALFETVSRLVGQNQSIGLEDKKRFMKAIEKGLGGY